MRTFLCLLCRRPALTLRKRRGGRTECNCMVPSIARSSIGLQASGCWWQIAFSNALIASEETRTIITPITLHRRRLTYYLRAEKKLRDQNLGRPWKRTQKKYSTESWEIAGNSWTVCWDWTLRYLFSRVLTISIYWDTICECVCVSLSIRLNHTYSMFADFWFLDGLLCVHAKVIWRLSQEIIVLFDAQQQQQQSQLFQNSPMN